MTTLPIHDLHEAPNPDPMQQHAQDVTRRALSHVPEHHELNGTGYGYGTPIFRNVFGEILGGIQAVACAERHEVHKEAAASLRRFRVAILCVGLALGFLLGRLL